MAYQVSFDAAEHIVVARVWGDTTREELVAMGDAAAVLCTESSCHRYLINLQDAVTPALTSTMCCYDFGESMARGVLPSSIHIALALPADSASAEDIRFAADVAMNRGRTVVTFVTELEARQWLGEKRLVWEMN